MANRPPRFELIMNMFSMSFVMHQGRDIIFQGRIQNSRKGGSRFYPLGEMLGFFKKRDYLFLDHSTDNIIGVLLKMDLFLFCFVFLPLFLNLTRLFYENNLPCTFR